MEDAPLVFSSSASVVTLVRALQRSIFKHEGISVSPSKANAICSKVFSQLLSFKQSAYKNRSWDPVEAQIHFASLNFLFRQHHHHKRATLLEALEKRLREARTVALAKDPTSQVFSERSPQAFLYSEHSSLLALLLELANEGEWMPISWEASEGTSHIFLPIDAATQEEQEEESTLAVDENKHSFILKQTLGQRDPTLNPAIFTLVPTGAMGAGIEFSSLCGALEEQSLPLNALNVCFALPKLDEPPKDLSLENVVNDKLFIERHVNKQINDDGTGDDGLKSGTAYTNLMGLATHHYQLPQKESMEHAATEICKKEWREMRAHWLKQETVLPKESLEKEKKQEMPVAEQLPGWDQLYKPKTFDYEASYSKNSLHIRHNLLKPESTLGQHIIYCLQGIPSSSFVYDDNLLLFSASPCRTKWAGEASLAGLMESIAYHGSLYRSLEGLASELSKDSSIGGLVSQSFASGLLTCLRHYRNALMTVPTSCAQRRAAEGSKPNPEVEPNGSLLEIMMHTRGLRKQLSCFGTLARVDITQNRGISNALPQGAALLSHLYNCGVWSYLELQNAPLIKFLFCRSFEPYLRMLCDWAYRGLLRDPFGEFFVKSREEDSLAFEERKKVSLPIFLRSLQHAILKCGWSLSILHKASEAHYRAVAVVEPRLPVGLCFSLQEVERFQGEYDVLLKAQQQKLSALTSQKTRSGGGEKKHDSDEVLTGLAEVEEVAETPVRAAAGLERKIESPPLSRMNTPEITTVRVKLASPSSSSSSSASFPPFSSSSSSSSSSSFPPTPSSSAFVPPSPLSRSSSRSSTASSSSFAAAAHAIAAAAPPSTSTFVRSSSTVSSSGLPPASNLTQRKQWQLERQQLSVQRKELRQTLAREWQAALSLAADFPDISSPTTPAATTSNDSGNRTSSGSSSSNGSNSISNKSGDSEIKNERKLPPDSPTKPAAGPRNGTSDKLGRRNSLTGNQFAAVAPSTATATTTHTAATTSTTGATLDSTSTTTTSTVAPFTSLFSQHSGANLSAAARSLGLAHEVASVNPFQIEEKTKDNESKQTNNAADAIAKALGILNGTISANPFRPTNLEATDSLPATLPKLDTTASSATPIIVTVTTTATTATTTATTATTTAVTAIITAAARSNPPPPPPADRNSSTVRHERRGSMGPPPPPPLASQKADEKLPPVPLSVLFNLSLVQALQSQCALVNRATRHFFLEHLKVEAHCAAVRKYVLMGAGDFGDVLSATLLEGVTRTPPVNWNAKANLRACLDYALRQCGYANDPFAKHLALAYDDKLETSGSSIDSLNALYLTYNAEWPLSLALTPAAIHAQSQAFTFLLRLRRAAKVLADVWTLHKLQELEEEEEEAEEKAVEASVAKKGAAASSPQASKTVASQISKLPAPRAAPVRSAAQRQREVFIRSVHTARFKMMQVVAGVSQFIGMTILQVLWAEFLAKLRAAESLDDIRESCDNYATKVLSSCFMGGRVEVALREVLQAALDFAAMAPNAPPGPQQKQVVSDCVAKFDGAVARLLPALRAENGTDLIGLLDLEP